MSLKKQIIDIRRRGITSPQLDPFEIGASLSIQEAAEGQINGKPSWEAQYGIYKNNYRVLLGDNTKPDTCLIGIGIDDDTWINFKPLNGNANSTNKEGNGESFRWNNVWGNTNILSRPAWNGIKTDCEINSLNDVDSVKFTLKLPLGATIQKFEGEQGPGDILMMYSGSEMGYIPAPSGYDANGLPMNLSYVILPDTDILGTLYPTIQLVGEVLPEHVLPFRWDPSLAYDYTDVAALRVCDTTNWTFDRTGAGKSWGAGGAEPLGDFPEFPVLFGRKSLYTVYIVDVDREEIDNPMVTFYTGGLNSMFRTNVEDQASLDMIDGIMCNPRPSKNSLLVTFNEDYGSNNRTGIYPNVSTAGKAYPGGISERDDENAFVADSDYNNLASTYSNPGGAYIQPKFLIDSAGDKYLLFRGYLPGDPTIMKLDLSQVGYSSTISGTSALNAVNFTNPVGGEVGLAAFTGGLMNIINEAEWTKNGDYSRKFYISGIGISSGKWVFASINNKLLICGTESIHVIDPSILSGAYSGNVPASTLITDGKDYVIGTETSTQTGVTKFIVPDVFKGALWTNVAIIEGTNYLLVTTTVGIFCLDITDKNNPIFIGYLDDVTASGIFAGFTLLTSDKNVKGASGAVTTLAFYTSSTLYIYGLGDTTPPTFAGWNPAKSEASVPIATNIYFEIDDDSAGVDEDTITVTIEGENAILNGVDQPKYSSSIVAAGLGYNITINPDINFLPMQVVNITLDADDLAGNPATQDVYSFTCGNWIYTGLPQPSIVYDGTTIYFPIPVRCGLLQSTKHKKNTALDGSIERINKGFPEELKVIITPVMDSAFDAYMKTFYEDWGGKRKWFTFTSGISTSYGGLWLLKPGKWRPKVMGGFNSYELIFQRPNNG